MHVFHPETMIKNLLTCHKQAMSHAGCSFELEIHEVKRSEESDEKERKVGVQRKKFRVVLHGVGSRY